MLQSFEKIKQEVKTTLVDINRFEMWRTSFDTGHLSRIIKVLEVVKATMEEISKESADLLVAEGAFECLFDELRTIGNNCLFGADLLERLELEISKRRNKKLISLTRS